MVIGFGSDWVTVTVAVAVTVTALQDEFTSWYGLIGTTWVGSLTPLGWFTKSISNKYQSREIDKLKVGDVIYPNNPPDGITTINTSYDKDNFIFCVPTYSTELGSTQPHSTKETQFYTQKYENMPQINRN